MVPTPPNLTALVHAQTRHLETSLALAGSLVRAGRVIDLTDLDQTAGLLCAQVLDLAAADGTACRPALLALLQSVDALVGALSHAATLLPRQKAEPCLSLPEPSSPPSQPSWASWPSSSWPAAPPG